MGDRSPRGPVFEDRTARGMTRPEYAEFLGYTNIESGIRQIHRWEYGDVPRTAKALSRLCGATGRRASYFRGDAVEGAPAPEIVRAVYEALGEALLIAAELAAEREQIA